MRLLCLGCEVFARVLYLNAAQSPHVVDVELLPSGLHENPADLHARLQERIDRVQSPPHDAIVLGYGLCGQAIAGLASQHLRLIVARAHDCITLFLGGRGHYQGQFADHPGTYWYTRDYLERNDRSSSSLTLAVVADKETDSVFLANVERFGRDNADYLWEVLGSWQAHYSRAAYIDIGLEGGAAVEVRAESDAIRRGWAFERVSGDLTLIRRLLFGDWDSDFIVVPPGEEIVASYDDQILSCRACAQAEPRG